MKIKYHLVKNIPKDLYKKMYSLNYRDGGTMQSELVWSKEQNNDTDFTLSIVEGDTLLGWLLVSVDYFDAVCLQIYIRKSARKKGLGSKLIKRAKKKLIALPTVYLESAPEFFKKHNLNDNVVVCG
jgi:GNAT superfamily N-acetyltransferase